MTREQFMTQMCARLERDHASLYFCLFQFGKQWHGQDYAHDTEFVLNLLAGFDARPEESSLTVLDVARKLYWDIDFYANQGIVIEEHRAANWMIEKYLQKCQF